MILSDFSMSPCKIPVKTHKEQDTASISFIFKFPTDWGACDLLYTYILPEPPKSENELLYLWPRFGIALKSKFPSTCLSTSQILDKRQIIRF